MGWQPGRRNLITDVPGFAIGQSHDEALRSGVTVILPSEPARGAADIRGGQAAIDELRQDFDAHIYLLGLADQLAFLISYKIAPLSGGG